MQQGASSLTTILSASNIVDLSSSSGASIFSNLTCTGIYSPSTVYNTGDNEIWPYMSGSTVGSQVGWQYKTCSQGTWLPDNVTDTGSDWLYTCANIPHTIYSTGCVWSGCATGYTPNVGSVGCTVIATASLCGASNGQTVASTGFSGALCVGGSSVVSWSGVGGTTTGSTLSWTCSNGTQTQTCSANYSRFATATTPTVAGATCDTYDILIGSLTGSYQIWAACNVGATTSIGYNTIPSQNHNPTTSGYLPQNHNPYVQGMYFQWGRNDDITSGTSTGGTFSGTLTNNSTTNSNFYQGDIMSGEWYAPDIGVSATDRWVATDQ